MKKYILLILFIILLAVFFIFDSKTLEKFSLDRDDLNGLQKRVNISDSQNFPPTFYEADNVEQMYFLNRIYPYGGQSDYEVSKFPNVVLPGDVVGCGSRREPCYGGSQQIIANLLPPLDISNKNISPRNLDIAPNPPYQEVGYLYKIMNPYMDNTYRPLFLYTIPPKVRYPEYKYFTINDEGVHQKVIIPSKYRELGTNDQVKIEGEDYYFRVTINQSNIPIYPRILTP